MLPLCWDKQGRDGAERRQIAGGWRHRDEPWLPPAESPTIVARVLYDDCMRTADYSIEVAHTCGSGARIRIVAASGSLRGVASLAAACEQIDPRIARITRAVRDASIRERRTGGDRSALAMTRAIVDACTSVGANAVLE